MGRMKDKYTDWDVDYEPNMLGKKGKKSKPRNPVVQALIDNPIRGTTKHKDKRGKKDKNYDDWKREVPPLLRRLRHNQKLAELISEGY